MKAQNHSTYLPLLREAREMAQKDRENFGALIQAFERIGAMEKGSLGNSLGDYKAQLMAIASYSPLSRGQPSHFHGSAERLFTLVQYQRNEAVHQGIIARNLVRHSVEFSIILEHALINMGNMKTAADLMVRDICYADSRHPMSYVRQRMLVNAYSFLPVETDGTVKMLSDFALAKWLRLLSWEEQKRALVRTLQDVMNDTPRSLELVEPISLPCNTPITTLTKSLGSIPLLLHAPGDKREVVGLISAFDLL